MHYKNGRPAQEADPVVAKIYGPKIVAGTLHSLIAGATTCNGQIAFPVPGGVNNIAITIGEAYHAEDAFRSLDAAMDNEIATAAGMQAATNILTGKEQ